MDNNTIPPKPNLDYLKDFNEFMLGFRRGEISGEEVGELIARMAQYYARYNMDSITKERGVSLVARDIENRTDDSGKAISSTKAKIFTDATDEMYEYKIAKGHRENIEHFINSLKSLQKGILNEYHHQGL